MKPVLEQNIQDSGRWSVLEQNTQDIGQWSVDCQLTCCQLSTELLRIH
jgi:hypothetical protein